MREVYKVDGGYGYRVEADNIRIKQEHKPAYSGQQIMTQKEAEKLSELVEQKIIQGIHPGVTKEQMESLWGNTKGCPEIIDEEKAWIIANPPKPPIIN